MAPRQSSDDSDFRNSFPVDRTAAEATKQNSQHALPLPATQTTPPRDALPSLKVLQELRSEIRALRLDIRRLGERLKPDGNAASQERVSSREVQGPVNRPTVVYQVGDLVVPLLGSAEKANFDGLKRLITSTIQPESWEGANGTGSIAQADSNLSLVVSQTEEVHRELQQLFSRLRTLQELQIVFDTSLITMTDEVARELQSGPYNTPRGELEVVSKPVLTDWIKALGKTANVEVSRLPRCTAMNSQVFPLKLPQLHDASLVIRGLARPNNSDMEVTIGVNGTNLSDSAPVITKQVKEGSALLGEISEAVSAEANLLRKIPGIIDIAGALRAIPNSTRESVAKPRVWVLITPTVIRVT